MAFAASRRSASRRPCLSVRPREPRRSGPTSAKEPIIHGDFAEILGRAKPGDFAYCDPPYVPVSETSSFTGYQAAGFGYSDQVRLRDVAIELKARGVHVLLSNSSAPLVFDLYKDFEIHVVEAPRSINSKADRRGSVKEVLIR